MRGYADFGAVVRTSVPVAHKPLGAGSSVLSSKRFSATAGTAACYRAYSGTALADPHKEGSTISGKRLSLAPEPGVVEPSYVAASGI